MWTSIIVAIIASIFAPWMMLQFQLRKIWKVQKKIEVKYSIYEDAVKALSKLSADALNPELQDQKPTYQGLSMNLHLRPETNELIEKSRMMVRAFFSDEASSNYNKALGTKISIEEYPNQEFLENRVIAILSLAKELGIS